jgi:hypothetical protein
MGARRFDRMTPRLIVLAALSLAACPVAAQAPAAKEPLAKGIPVTLPGGLVIIVGGPSNPNRSFSHRTNTRNS